MAVSDPTAGVPTPTGVLQGAAVFSWDGSTWQPAGRASVGVGTPTGVLRGVAPFSWSGSAWTPAGGGPEVAATGGVLDGVAVYTWSGSAWVPAGGGPDVPTPTGTLQGIAAFYWDGTAWQPSGQAGPDVATPVGVLQGMAMFNVTATGAVPAAIVDLNFMTGVLPSSVTFTRAGAPATYFDATGTMQTVAINVPRFDHDPVTLAPLGLLIEESRTNLLLNSATLGTQSVATTAQAYTLSFYGTGSVTLSGTSSGTTTGTGVATRVFTTFTPTAGTLTLTVSGSVVNAQLEAGAFRTSYIPTTSTTQNRAADVATLASASIPGRHAAAETFAADFMMVTAQEAANPRVIADANGQSGPVFQTPAYQVGEYDGVAAIQTANSFVLGAVAKVASTWTSGNAQICLNAGTVVTGATLTAGFGGITTFKFLGDAAPTDQSNGYIRRFRYWPRTLSTAEMQQVTT